MLRTSSCAIFAISGSSSVRAVAGACPALIHAKPGGAVVVVATLTIPVEVHAHPAELVRVNLVAGLADDHGGLRPLHDGFAGHPRWPETRIDRVDHLDFAFVRVDFFFLAFCKRPLAGPVIVVLHLVFDPDSQVLLVQLVPG